MNGFIRLFLGGLILLFLGNLIFNPESVGMSLLCLFLLVPLFLVFSNRVKQENQLKDIADAIREKK